MFEELETFIRSKMAWLYKTHQEKYNEEVLQDDIFKDFTKELKTQDFILALCQDVRFIQLFEDWIKTLTWQQIMLQEKEKRNNFDYQSFFSMESRANKKGLYQKYLNGEKIPADINNICYVYQHGSQDIKVRLELVFPLLFGKE